MNIQIKYTGLILAAALAACGQPNDSQSATSETAAIALPAGDVTLNLDIWEKADVPVRKAADAAIEEKITGIIAKMTVEEKVGQILQPEILNVTPEDIRDYNLGSVLNGGNGRPNKDIYAKPSDWLALADSFYDMSVDTSDGGVGIPLIWGIDSVHGNNSVFGGTIFPHNIGLGASNDPELLRKIGRVTAVESAAIGTDWTFAPAVSVARDDRWGRTYESYSEDPDIAGRMGAALTIGLQGDPKKAESFFPTGSIIATVKHFIADGGTENGRDQGDAKVSEKELREIHMPPYVDGIEAGAQTIMASYSKWNGVRMHGHGPLLTSLLKDHVGFDGFVIGDFNGHALIPGCTNWDCPEALMAGVDMYMIPVDWKELYGNLVKQANNGEITQERLDDAVRRILRVKARAGLFDAGRPSERPFAGKDHIGTKEHKAVAREAARKSVVLLKNENSVLPLAPTSKVLVAGSGGHDLPMLVGGWSMNWQGSGLTNKDFPTGASVLNAVKGALKRGGGEGSFNAAGNYDEKPDAAIVVFGEKPYAEYQGDRESVLYSLAENDPDLAVMRKLQAQGIPVISVFVSGRPLWINPHLNSSDAMIAAFLPGTEGGRGLADLIIQDTKKAEYDFTGKLSFSWPKTGGQTPLNAGDSKTPLFKLGYGLSLGEKSNLGKLSEDPELSDTLLAAAASSVLFEDGRALAPWRIYLGDSKSRRLKTEGDRFVESAAGAIKYESADRNRQEDTKMVSWSGNGRGSMFVLGYSNINFSRQASDNQAIIMNASLLTAPSASVTAAFGNRNKPMNVDITEALSKLEGKGWSELSIPLACFKSKKVNFKKVNMPFEIATEGKLVFQLADLRMGEAKGVVAKCPK